MCWLPKNRKTKFKAFYIDSYIDIRSVNKTPPLKADFPKEGSALRGSSFIKETLNKIITSPILTRLDIK
jgi:hypothetical protein